MYSFIQFEDVSEVGIYESYLRPLWPSGTGRCALARDKQFAPERTSNATVVRIVGHGWEGSSSLG